MKAVDKLVLAPPKNCVYYAVNMVVHSGYNPIYTFLGGSSTDYNGIYLHVDRHRIGSPCAVTSL